jgi:phosphoglycolate phosphatase-like HAD superfamily hydrolase
MSVNFAVWLDGVILKVDLTDRLYEIYKGGSAELPVTYEAFEDALRFLEKVSRSNDVVIMSPYDENTTRSIMERLNLDFDYVANEGKTKPSKTPYEKLFSIKNWDPLDTFTVGASPLDLLSTRFYDSRIKVICVNRFVDCSRYSPYLMVSDLDEAVERLTRLKKVQL